MDVLKQMHAFCQEHELIKEEQGVVVAVSGGPDSVALLHLLLRLSKSFPLRLIVAHANHQLRPSEADQEEEGVRRLATQWHLPFETTRLNVAKAVEENGANLQDVARQLRYAWLERVATKHQAKRIALAHHADDQAETVLMRILRGTGSDGLEGIPVCRRQGEVEVIRPVLWCDKLTLTQYCHEHHLQYFVDSSNASRKYLRNELRLDVLPQLERYNPQLKQGLIQLAELMTAENDYMDKQAESCLGTIADSTIPNDRWNLSREVFLARPLALQRRMIKLILSYLFVKETVDFRKIEQIRKAIQQVSRPNLRLDLGERVQLIREYDSIAIARNKRTSATSYANYVVSHCPMQVMLTDRDFLFSVQVKHTPDVESVVSEEVCAVFDYALIQFPLTLRSRKAGDRIQLPNVAGRKKVKDVLIDAKVPATEREKLVLVEDASGQVLWIAGVRVSSVAQISEHTVKYLHMTLRKIIH